MATAAYSTALLGGARLAAVGAGAAAVPPSILLPRRNGNLTPLRLQGENTIICGESAPLHSGNFSGCIILTVPREMAVSIRCAEAVAAPGEGLLRRHLGRQRRRAHCRLESQGTCVVGSIGMSCPSSGGESNGSNLAIVRAVDCDSGTPSRTRPSSSRTPAAPSSLFG
ncbi:hypothetical protein C2845_PM12G26760 [Panicum miliaceum]|uniref:Uncharacterized protein n=1 Tax=Panicum miliaceum TaxID=4540 RepID=A0A3L6QN43_PANMI|nr:hypothetical protein C2845_PM12G26760 [Panicum miliaceum]